MYHRKVKLFFPAIESTLPIFKIGQKNAKFIDIWSNVKNFIWERMKGRACIANPVLAAAIFPEAGKKIL